MQRPERTRVAYTGPRPDIAALLPAEFEKALDVGCSDGTLGMSLREAGREVWGIEQDSEFAEKARARLDRVVCGDATEALGALEPGGFDLIICADVLEHLPDPWAALRGVHRALTANGHCIVSLPNVQFWTTFTQLGLHGRWPRKDRGVHDRTHLSWFTDKDARQLFADTGFAVDANAANYRFSDDPFRRGNRLARYVAVPPLRRFLAYQNLYRLRPE